MVTIHILHEGFAVCGFSDSVPGHWPKNHTWVGIAYFYQYKAAVDGVGNTVYCKNCKKLARIEGWACCSALDRRKK